MNLMRPIAAAVLACAVIGCSGCGEVFDSTVRMALWHQGATDEEQAFWTQAVDAFIAENPDVAIDIQTTTDEEYDGQLQAAMEADTLPDIFFFRGGFASAELVEAGSVMDLTGKIDADVTADYPQAAFGLTTMSGKIMAVPLSAEVEGIWYSQNLFAQAGVAAPADMASLTATVSALRGVGVQPIALGAKEPWTAAHWLYSFALRECPLQAIDSLSTDASLADPCWLRSFADLDALNKVRGFNDGYLDTPADQGADSASGLMANHLAGMELMGAWESSGIARLTPDGKPLADLGWFQFPAVQGGAGDPAAVMARADSYACRHDAPDVCADFLNFIATQEWSRAYAAAYSTTPVNSQARVEAEVPALATATATLDVAPYIVPLMDVMVGSAADDTDAAVIAMLAGQLDPAGALAQMQAALANR